MIEYPIERVEYGELEDALGWIVEAPFRAGVDLTAEAILGEAAKQLDVAGHGFGEFSAMGFLRVLSGDCGLEPAVIKELVGSDAALTKLAILVGIAASRGKCPGP